MPTESMILLGLALVVGFYMAWNIGANDVANAMGTSVGSGALTLRNAIIAAAIFEFAGAYFVGANVSSTIRKGIFDPSLITDPNILAAGMIAALLSAGVWLQIASYFGWPVSTTHSIVGAVVGFGCVSVGMQNIEWANITQIAMSWVISPLVAGSISYLLFRMLLHLVFYQRDPIAAAKKITPFLVFVVVIVLVGVTSFKALKNIWKSVQWNGEMLTPHHPLAIASTTAAAAIFGVIAAIIAAAIVRRIKSEPIAKRSRFETVYVTRSLDKAIKHLRRIENTATDDVRAQTSHLLERAQAISTAVEKQADPDLTRSAYAQVERIFVYLQILSACFVAFAHGANDVANAIGPLSAAVQALRDGVIAAKTTVSPMLLALGGVGIVIGLATWGWRVMQTIGRRITELTPTRGFSAEFGAATTILIASLSGLPISTTHTLVGAVLGVGLARGIGAINLNVVRDIIASWVVTIPAGAGLAIAFYYALRLAL